MGAGRSAIAAAGRAMRRLARAERGQVAVIFALVMLPMIGVVGLGIDVARTLSARTTLQASADAAALAAATEAEATLQSQYNSPQIAAYAGTAVGMLVFNANATKVGRWLGGTPTPTVQVNPGSANITATVTFQAAVPTTFGRIFGTPTFNIAGSASSSLSLPKYLNISVVADISQSMGLAATTAGQSQLQSLTPDQCAFGCHVAAQAQLAYSPPYTASYESIAHNANPPIQLRIDVIRSATQNMIQTAQQGASSTPLISFGLYTMQGGNNQSAPDGNTANGQPLTTLSAPTTNYNALLSAAAQLDLGANNETGVGDTDAVDAMPALTSTVQASGDGNSAGSPQQFVFLLTDGVVDVWAANQQSCPANTIGWNGSHCTLPFNSSWCSALKTQKNVTVGVIYTTYLPMNGDGRYEQLVAPFVSQLKPNLSACASSGWFYEASDATSIQTAINALFAQATGRGVLTH